MDYNILNSLFKRTANKVSRSYIGSDCYAYKNSEDESITIRFINVNILTYYKNKTFSSDSSKERTNTIKRKINLFFFLLCSFYSDSSKERTNTIKRKINLFCPLGFSLHSKKGEWIWNDGQKYSDNEVKKCMNIRDIKCI